MCLRAQWRLPRWWSCRSCRDWQSHWRRSGLIVISSSLQRRTFNTPSSTNAIKCLQLTSSRRHRGQSSGLLKCRMWQARHTTIRKEESSRAAKAKKRKKRKKKEEKLMLWIKKTEWHVVGFPPVGWPEEENTFFRTVFHSRRRAGVVFSQSLGLLLVSTDYNCYDFLQIAPSP